MITMNDYIDRIRNKSIGVLGVGVSNLPLINTLLEHGIHDITACDARPEEELGDTCNDLISKGVSLQLGEHYLDSLPFDVIFRTPGLMPFDQHLVKARDNGSVITSEMEAFFEICPCKIIAVTGSDGKTTTTTIISELLKQEGYRVHLGGNIGKPLFSEVESFKPEDIAVLELSSFQLHSMKCHPDISVITNISPNHLDKHIDYPDYYNSKSNIFINQDGNDVLILNAKDELSEYYAGLSHSNIKYFSRDMKVDDGVYCDDKYIYFSHKPNEEMIMDIADIRLPGVHNLENYLAAICAVGDLVSHDTCRIVAREFGGVEHRLEFVRDWKGITFINDSIGTSPTRTIAGLHSMKKKPILIAGGYDKDIPFDELGVAINDLCKAVFLTGHTAEKIEKAVVEADNFEKEKILLKMVDDFTECVMDAAHYAEKGDIVLLSPACAAFDHFKNFAERGTFFKNLVNTLE